MIRFAILLSISMIGFASTSSFATSEEISIATGEWPPYSQEKREDKGLVNNALSEVLGKLGYKAAFKFMPWKRALEVTRNGKFQATSFWYYDEARDQDFYHVGPVSREQLVFAYRKSEPAPTWTVLNDLSDRKIGGVVGLTYTEEFWRLIEEKVLNVQMGPNDQSNLRKLLAGRIDLYPISKAVGVELLNREFSAEERDQLAFSEQLIDEKIGYILFSREVEGNKQIAEKVQEALDLNID